VKEMRQPCSTNIAGLIVAGGYSSRMGTFKPLLPLGNKTVLEMAVNSLRQGGIHDIRVVVGYKSGSLLPLLKDMSVTIIKNEDYAQGMFSSIVTGLAGLANACEAFFLLPGDIPLIRPHSIRSLLHVYRKTKAPVIYPVYKGVRGHPPLIAAECFSPIIEGRGEGGLREILYGFENRCIEVDLPNQGVLVDIDTPEDYQRLQKMFFRRDLPSAEECLALLYRYQPGNEKLWRHGQKVADVAMDLAIALAKSGLQFDIDLLRTGCLMHDIGKNRPNHAKRGERWLRCQGYPTLASLVGTHMELPFIEETLPDEKTLLFIADKLVQEDRIVSLDERFAPALRKFSQEPAVLAKVLQKKHTAEAILQQICRLAECVPAR